MDPDRVRGMLWGAACGSAVGLHYHGRDPVRRGDAIPPAAAFGEKPDTPHGKHPPAAFSALLEPAVLAARAIHQNRGVFESDGGARAEPSSTFLRAYAAALADWTQVGVREWGDSTTPFDMDYQVFEAAKQSSFRDDPFNAARTCVGLPNDCAALLRALAAATLPTAEAAEEAAIFSCRVTHRAPSVTAAAVFATLVLQTLLYGSAAPLKEALTYAAVRTGIHAQGGARVRLFRALGEKVLDQVGGRDYQGSHIASLRCFVFAFRRIMVEPAAPAAGSAPAAGTAPAPPAAGAADAAPGEVTASSPQEIWQSAIGSVCIQGGSADVNAGLAGAVVGARYGMAGVPPWFREMPHADWLESEIERVVSSATGRPAPSRARAPPPVESPLPPPAVVV